MENERERGRDRRETGGGERGKNREETVSEEGRLEEIVKRTGREKEGREKGHGGAKEISLGVEYWERRGNVKSRPGIKSERRKVAKPCGVKRKDRKIQREEQRSSR